MLGILERFGLYNINTALIPQSPGRGVTPPSAFPKLAEACSQLMEHRCVTALLFCAHIQRFHKDKKAVAIQHHKAFFTVDFESLLHVMQVHESCHKTTDAELAFQDLKGGGGSI